jgi:general secretion pathway protein F
VSDGTYAYRAARRDGALEIGSIEAVSHEAAATLLAARGLFPVEIRREAVADQHRISVSQADLGLGLHLLATLLESGLPISRALQVLEELAPASWRAGLPSVREAVREGKGLAPALRGSPLSVPPLVVGIVRAGEAGSRLAEAVRRAAGIMESQAATRAALRSALAYPCILAAAGAASVALLVGLVLPRFAAILADLGHALPPSTRIVLGAADALRVAALPGTALLVVAALVWRGWTATDAGRQAWHDLLLRVPVLGSVRRSAATGRACAALAALLESGVPLAPALLHAAPATGDAAVAARLTAAREAILRGQGIGRALEAEGGLTISAIRLVHAGEASGQLARMLVHAASLEAERTGRQVQAMVRMIEPLLILLFGGIVALVAAALLQAVYSVRPGL